MAANYRLPERSGEVLIDPPWEQIPGLLAAGRAAGWGTAEILGIPLAEFRRQLRLRALALAARSGPAAASDRPWVVMAHQPVFFHPGVWMKYFLLSRLSSDLEATGLHLIVDSDATGPITAEIPSRRDGLVRAAETLLPIPDDVPLEALGAPRPEEWDGFCRHVRADLSTLPSREPLEHFDIFAGGWTEAREGAGTLAGFLAGLRRVYETRALPPRYLELPVSALCDTAEFRAFALHLIRDPDEIRRRYNATLEEYRRIHRLRSAANPFPNLGDAGGLAEMPFWMVRDGRRQDLYARRDGSRLRLGTSSGVLVEVSPDWAGAHALAASGIVLRPKAITFTMFARLGLSDLFLHGVGGGRYDRVTDVLIAEIFGCTPPPYVVATATVHLPLGEESRAEDARALERRLMDLQHNPERYLGTTSEAQRRLVEEKWALIHAAEQMRPGPERRAVAQRIRALNGALAEGLAAEITRLRDRLAGLSRRLETEEVVSYRGYPFFLFDPAAVCALASPPVCRA